MLLIPAIDLKDGHCVRLKQGEMDAATVFSEDPRAMARHWLDVARYGDTKGYAFTMERRFAFAYTYRDYVIESFNNDKPFNDFIREQIAGDVMTAKDSRDRRQTLRPHGSC